MKVAVLSGKGGAGKTMVSVNLACASGAACYIDADVEEPNGRLFLKPGQTSRSQVFVGVPRFDETACTGCRRCVEFCRFNALAYVAGRHKLFEQVCHDCGGCKLVCPAGAVGQAERPVGWVERGARAGVEVITGILNVGESSAMPVIRAALREGFARQAALTVIDCPPGSACSVMECVSNADYCLLVAEPTAFGLDNLNMVHELSALLKKPCGLVINRQTAPYGPLEDFCARSGVPVLARIPYSARYAALCAQGGLLCECDGEARSLFETLLKRIGGECA